MSNELHSIDKYLRSEIEGMEMLPSEQVWNSIESKLDAKQSPGRSSRMNYKLVAGLGAAAILTSVLVYNYTTSSNSTQKQNDGKQITAPVQTPVETNAVTAPKKNVAVTDTRTETHVTVSSSDAVASKPVSGSSSKETFKGEQFSGMTESQETYIKPKTISAIVSEQKDVNSDKSILLLPYFSSTHVKDNSSLNEKQVTTNIPSVKNELAEPPKVEPKENVIYMPNAFTPNGDGLNDVFVPQTAENIKEYKLSIFDRSGKLVYLSDDIQKGWDGRAYENGTETVKEDVYIWRIEMKNTKGEKEHLMGSVTLLK